MNKTEQEQQYDYLMSKIIAPYLKDLDYKKKGNNFRFYDTNGEFGKIVNFQKSMWGNKYSISFTVNVGIYLAEFEYYHRKKNSGEKFTEPACAVRRRIGRLKNDRDTWYNINEETNIAQLQQTVEGDFVKYVLPYLNKIKTREDVINLLCIESSYYPIARIKTLYNNGKQQIALNLLGDEYRTATDVGKQLLDDLKQQLNDGKGI